MAKIKVFATESQTGQKLNALDFPSGGIKSSYSNHHQLTCKNFTYKSYDQCFGKEIYIKYLITPYRPITKKPI